jgi:hypothetical protein
MGMTLAITMRGFHSFVRFIFRALAPVRVG